MGGGGCPRADLCSTTVLALATKAIYHPFVYKGCRDADRSLQWSPSAVVTRRWSPSAVVTRRWSPSAVVNTRQWSPPGVVRRGHPTMVPVRRAPPLHEQMCGLRPPCSAVVRTDVRAPSAVLRRCTNRCAGSVRRAPPLQRNEADGNFRRCNGGGARTSSKDFCCSRIVLDPILEEQKSWTRFSRNRRFGRGSPRGADFRFSSPIRGTMRTRTFSSPIRRGIMRRQMFHGNVHGIMRRRGCSSPIRGKMRRRGCSTGMCTG